MQIGVTFPSSTDFPATLAEMAAYDAAGVDAIWLGESYGFDALTPLGALTQLTSRALLGTGIVSAYSRTPTALAQSAYTLDALSDGRAVLGLGASGPAVIEGWHGVAYQSPVARISDTIDLCRKIWRREQAVGLGTHPVPVNQRRPLKIMAQGARSEIPIYVAALGTRSVQMTATKADGWLAMMFWPERAGEVWGEALASGAAARSDELQPLRIVAPAYVAIESDEAEHLQRLRAHTAHYVGGMGPRGQNFYHEVLCRYGLEADADRIAELYLDKRRDEAADAVPDDYLHGVSLIGSRRHVEQRLRAYAAAGVSMLNVTLAGQTVDERVEQLTLLKELATGIVPAAPGLGEQQ